MDILDINKLKHLIKKKNLNDFEDEILLSIWKDAELLLNRKLKEYKNKLRIIHNDEKKEHKKALNVLTDEQVQNLPTWVKNDIKNAYIVGASENVIQTSDKRKYHLKNKLNDLSWWEWTFFLNSVINTRYTTGLDDWYAHHIRKIHPSPKPPQLMENIIKFFTKENELVLDYFMWVWWTLLWASLCNRRAIWIDLSNDFIETYKEANKYLWLKEQKTFKWDSIKMLKSWRIEQELWDEKISLILIDPPYWDMMNRKKTWEALKQNKDTSATPYTLLKEDLWNMESLDFRKIFKQSIENSMKLLKEKWHIVIFIKDMQPKGKELNLLHCNMILDLNEIENLNYLGTKIWADQGVNLFPYWYPYSYVSNQIHQYILIFKKV